MCLVGSNPTVSANKHTNMNKNPTKSTHMRRTKRIVGRRAKRLALHSYAKGCRGHVGVIIEKNHYFDYPYESDVLIRSIVDGVVESCSIFHCAPVPVTVEYAQWTLVPFNRMAEDLAAYIEWGRTFPDRLGFSEHYPEDNYKKDVNIIGVELVKLKDLIDNEEQSKIVASLEYVYKKLISGDRNFTTPTIYVGKRIRNKPRPCDFDSGLK